MLYGAPAPVYEFTSSGLDHVDEMYAIADNPYRVAGPCMVPNFGLVEIDWGDPEAPLLTFLSLDDRGKEIFSYNIKTMHQ